MNQQEFPEKFLRLLVKVLGSPGWSSRFRSSLNSGADACLTKFISEMSEELALRMGMFHYSEYYTFDHVFYKEKDRIAEGILPFETSIVKGTWLKHIRVAFEHENRLDNAGGYQEISKLILVNADVKVLMGWAGKGNNYDSYALDYQKIFAASEQSEFATPILFIGEYTDAHFDAYLITFSGLLKYDFEKNNWIQLDCLNKFQ